VESLSALHNPSGILFDPFVEKTFGRPPQEARPHLEPWVGVVHVPPFIPSWHPQEQSNNSVFSSEAWLTSRRFCQGLYVLSSFHAPRLRNLAGVPVNCLLHPTEFPDVTWNVQRFRDNPEKKIIQVGWWLRRIYSIYLLKVNGYRKIFLRKDEDRMDELLATEFAHTPEKERLTPRVMSETGIQTYLSNARYDQLLSENIVFLDLYDASANNAIVECIARNTPVLVNPLEAVVEYLGKDYPLYFTTLEEAAAKAEDAGLVVAAHEYLVNYANKHRFTGEYFRESIIQSPIYQSL
jgi:hypothetical protein